MEVNSDSLKNILTLRYDPSFEPLLPKQRWENFQEKKSSNYLNVIFNFKIDQYADNSKNT